jgi:hypothetical protein
MSGPADDRTVEQVIAHMEAQLRIINGERTGETRVPFTDADRAVLGRVAGADLTIDNPGEHPDSLDMRVSMGFYLAFLWRNRARLEADEFCAFVAQHSLMYARYVRLFGNTIELAPAVPNDESDAAHIAAE